MTLGAGLAGAHASATDPPSMLTWNSEPLNRDFDMTGDIELRLDATSTAWTPRGLSRCRTSMPQVLPWT